MKKALSILIAVMMLLLTACGADPAQAGDTQPPQDSISAEQAASTDAEYHVEEKTLEDGSKVTFYRLGGPEGTPVKAVMEFPDGAYYEEIYNADGNLASTHIVEADGSIGDTTFYPSGNIQSDIWTYPDGSYEEYHFLDDGTIDEEGWITSGTIIYEKRVSADGTVKEFSYDITKEADGSWWTTEEWDDGTISRTHYSENGLTIESYLDNAETGRHVVELYYENGNIKSSEFTFDNSEEYSLIEYYEDGTKKYVYSLDINGTEQEEEISPIGYSTYFRLTYQDGTEMEFFADENGNLEKYVENGKVSEGNAIASYTRDSWERLKTKPDATAQDSVTVQNDDGTKLTTTTYSDGTVVEELYSADDLLLSQNTIYSNGEENYQEFHENGTIRIGIQKFPDITYETHYDDEGYVLYYREERFGTVTEIFTDENGRLKQVLVDGKEQTDVSSWENNFNFRK